MVIKNRITNGSSSTFGYQEELSIFRPMQYLAEIYTWYFLQEPKNKITKKTNACC